MRSSKNCRVLVLTLSVFAVACEREPVGPAGVNAPPVTTAQASGDEGPPPRHRFGPDTYRIGVFTGEGVTPTGLECTSSATGQVCNGFLASDVDGTRLDVRLAVPAAVPGVLHPLVVLVHGYGGSKSSSGDIADALFADGYAVLRYSTRGFGKSWGQVNLADEHAEIADLRSMVGQVVDDPRFALNPDAVAVTGASYGGGHSWMSLLQPTFSSPSGAAVRIRAVVPIAPWTDLLYALVPNGSARESLDRPGGAKISFIDALFIGGAHEPTKDRPYVNYPDYLFAWGTYLNGAEPNEVDPIYQQLSDGLAGYRSIWWRRDFWQRVARNRVPIFQVQGLTDDLFPLPEGLRMLLALRAVDPTYPITSYFGDLGHPRARNKQAEVDYVLGLIRTWLAHYLKGEGAEPTPLVYAAITRPSAGFNSGDVIAAADWHALEVFGDPYVFPNQLPQVLLNPGPDAVGGVPWDPILAIGVDSARTFVPAAAPESDTVATSLAHYEAPVHALNSGGGGSLLIAGRPMVSLQATTLAHRVQLNVRMFDVPPVGKPLLITRGTYTLDSGTIGVPLGTVSVTIPTYGNVWEVPAGHRVRIDISNVDTPYLRPSAVISATTISGVSLQVPVARR